MPTAADPLPSGSAGSARGLWLLLALYLGTLVLAAALTPPVYWWIHGWAEGGSGDLARYLADKELPRYFDRIRWLVVLAALPWLCRATGLTGRRTLGLIGGRRAWRLAAAWLAAGLGMVAAIAGGQLAAGTAALRGTEDGLAAALAAGVGLALVSALLVAFFEELVFRGVVFQLAHRALPAWGSVPVAAGIFALLHFQRVPGDAWPAGEPVSWTSGFTVAWRSVAGMAPTPGGAPDLPVLAALFFAGAVLCLLFLRHGTLLAPMGLHAGWVWAAGIHRRFVRVDPEADTAFWGGRDFLDGALPLGLLVLLLAGMLLAFRYSAARIGGRPGEG